MPNANDTKLKTSAVEQYPEFVKFYGRHLVALSGTYIPIDGNAKQIGPEELFWCSGFVMSVGAEWFFVTAGHVFWNSEADDDNEADWGLDRLVSKGKIKILQWGLKDDFGSGAKFPDQTFISYDLTRPFYRHDQNAGIDFGAIQLREFYRKSLEVNGIAPITEEMWCQQEGEQFDAHLLLGLPSERKEPTRSTQTTFGDTLSAGIQPILLGVTQTDRPHRPLPESAFPWFVGEVHTDALNLNSIKGMSGGPIFGLKKLENELWEYQLVALQSWWDEKSRTIYGCPVSVFGPLLLSLRQSGEEPTMRSNN